MNRRELIKAILPVASIPLVVKGEEVGKALRLDPDAKYVIVLRSDTHYELADSICQNGSPFPPGTQIYFTDDPENDIKIFKL